MLPQEAKIREFVRRYYAIDESKLSFKDVKQLAHFYVSLMEKETPMVAADTKADLGL